MQHHPLEGTHWLQQAHNEHHLLVDGHWQASVQLKMRWTGYHNAEAHIADEVYTFEEVGQWKRHILIKDDYDDIVGEVTKPKWYSSNLDIHYKERTYTVRSKNSPLVEYALCQGDIPLLRYSLSFESMKMRFHRKAGKHEVPLLLEVALWYLFPAKMGNIMGWAGNMAMY